MENLENSIFNIFFKISKTTFKILYNELNKINIHPGQPPILLILLKENKLSQTEIAKRVCVKTSTITTILKIMKKNGLIKKIIDKKDRRIFYISLTPKGEEKAKETLKILEKLETFLKKNLEKNEIETLNIILNKILLNLSEFESNFKINKS